MKLTGRTLKEMARGGTEAEWTQSLAKKAMEQLPNNIREVIHRSGMVDITSPVKAGLEMSRRLGLGREPFKRLIGMEARVFMREDGRVFINFTNMLAHPNPAASFLTRTLENKAALSKPAEDGVREASRTLQQWKEDVSAWWSGQATGQF